MQPISSPFRQVYADCKGCGKEAMVRTMLNGKCERCNATPKRGKKS